MSYLRGALAIVLIFLLHAVFPAQQATIALDKNDPELRAILTEIGADAESARLKAKIPGMSIVIVYDQDVLLAKGFGYADLEKKILADPQTVYRVGSVTKAFTARASIKRQLSVLVSPPRCGRVLSMPRSSLELL